MLYVETSSGASQLTPVQFLLFVLNGVFFHFQSITAYVLMDYISPVTHR
jgi:solute carrier family 35 protein E2